MPKLYVSDYVVQGMISKQGKQKKTMMFIKTKEEHHDSALPINDYFVMNSHTIK